MAGIAYSYLRFSTPEQAAGDSRRRQMKMAEQYAADHHLRLDQSLSFHDLGISAFRGRNAKEGALRAFLDAIEHNLVPPGAFLLIESLDRLSRERILAAQALFLQIIQAGVVIVTLGDQRSYSLQSLNGNPLDLIISLVSMMRANEESQMKSSRIRAAFDAKRANLATKPWSARCPGWLRLDKASGKFIIVEDRANVIRRIYRDALSGVSHQTIARKLNEEQTALFGHGNQRGKIWQKSSIRHYLQTPSVVGTLVPFTSEYPDGVKRMRPLAAVEGYYPSIIDRADWDRIQARRVAWGEHYRLNVPKTGRANLLAGLSRCPFCERPMVLMCAGNNNWRYYLCRKAYNGAGCSDHWVRYSGIEDVLTCDIEEVIKTCPKPALTSDARSLMLRHIRDRLHTLRQQRASMVAEHLQLRQSLRPVNTPRQATEVEIERLLAERKRLRVDRPRWLDVTLAAKLDKLRAVAKAIPLDRMEIYSVLRSLMTKVVIDWENNQLRIFWKHGGKSFVPVAMKPQRKVENPRRANRPQYHPGENAPALPSVER